jgi:SAM-dependent methyltransferase
MTDQSYTKDTGVSCPICHTTGLTVSTGRRIANGIIRTCKECSGYFLHPPYPVKYNNPGWNSKRETSWQRDIQIAKEYAPRIVRYLEKLSSRPIRHVLEIGCGTGFMGIGFESTGCNYTGIDIDEIAIEFAKRNGINAQCAMIENIQNAPSDITCNYDLIISSHTFEHIEDPSKAFSNLKLISDNGIIVIIVPNAKGLFARIKSNRLFSKIIQLILGEKRDIAYSIDGYCHNFAYTVDTLRYLCAKENIDLISVNLLGINDPIFGFVQENSTLLYKLVSSIAHLLKMESEIILIGRLHS